MKHKILVTVPIDHMPAVVSRLESAAEVDYLIHPSRNDLENALGSYDAIFTNTFNKIDESLLKKAPKLKIISTPSTGTDHIDKYACDKLGVKWQSLTKDISVLENIPSTAELAFTLMLCVLRNVKGATKSVLENNWDYRPYRGREIQDLSVGIVGYGRLGKIFARLLSGFQANIFVYDPNVRVENPTVSQVRSMEELFSKCEVIALHLHLTEETYHLFDEKMFQKMRKGSYLINTSRGGIIDSEALVDALENGTIKAAGVDVIEGEVGFDTQANPLVEYAKNNDNLIISPHMGGMTFEAQNKAFGYAASKLVSYLANLNSSGNRKITLNEEQL